MQQTNKEKQHDNRRDNEKTGAATGSDRNATQQNVGSNEDGVTREVSKTRTRELIFTRIQEGESLEDALDREDKEADLRAEYMLEAMFDKEQEDDD